MLKQPELFQSVNQIPPTGLQAKKEQAIDPLEGLRRKEEAKEEVRGLFSGPQPGETWESKETGLQVQISHLTPGLIWYNMEAWNRPQATGVERFLETMKKEGNHAPRHAKQ